jgi:hypothetical protein
MSGDGVMLADDDSALARAAQHGDTEAFALLLMIASRQVV